MDKIIFHIDVNSAFLSWEAVYRLCHKGSYRDLREEISAVGGDAAMRHGIILAKSIPAKKFGIHTGESIFEARRKCPELLIVPPNYSLYEKSSAAFMSILREYTPDVEIYSIDEAFMDMSGIEAVIANPWGVADEIRRQIKERLGFTVNVGVSVNKLLAKMASDFKKPDKVHTLFPEEIPSKMWPLPVGVLFFVGRATQKKLHALGVYTIGDLARQELSLLKYHFKTHGEVIWAFANGIDTSVVTSVAPPNKGYDNSTTAATDVTDADSAKRVLLSLSEMVAARLREDHVKAEVIAVGIKSTDFQYKGHQMTLTNATHITLEIYEYACRLFDELWDGSPIRHLGIHTGKIQDAAAMRQLDMFEHWDYEKLEKLDMTVDEIRARFGRDAVFRAAFAKPKQKCLEHMAGGVSREKWTVDYK